MLGMPAVCLLLAADFQLFIYFLTAICLHFLTGCIYERTSLKHVKFYPQTLELENPLECQKLCEEDEGCKFFMYQKDGTCKFTKEENENIYYYDKYDETIGQHWYSGPAVCSEKEIPFCQFFDKNE